MDSKGKTNNFLWAFLFFLSHVTDVLFISASLWIIALGNVLIWQNVHSFVVHLLFTIWAGATSAVARGWLKFYWNAKLAED
jgi:hypothetical protein